jgi:hypothetical protein
MIVFIGTARWRVSLGYQLCPSMIGMEEVATFSFLALIGSGCLPDSASEGCSTSLSSCEGDAFRFCLSFT